MVPVYVVLVRPMGSSVSSLSLFQIVVKRVASNMELLGKFSKKLPHFKEESYEIAKTFEDFWAHFFPSFSSFEIAIFG